eukprot:226514-Pelagomonas_calceolata.AAC.1
MSVKAHENWGPGKTGKLHGRQHARVSKTPAFAVEMLVKAHDRVWDQGNQQASWQAADQGVEGTCTCGKTSKPHGRQHVRVLKAPAWEMSRRKLLLVWMKV